MAGNDSGIVRVSGRKMSAGELKALLAAERYSALSAMMASKLSDERATALNYYYGDMSKDMPAPEGRSQAISSDVADTVEGMMPQLMEIFSGGDDVVRFDPVGPQDVQAAEQETDYVNHVFMQKNPGFLILYSFIKDALLSKNGIAKVWWESKEEVERETYLDLAEDQFAIIAGDPDVEIVEHTEHEPEQNAAPGLMSALPGAPGAVPPDAGAPSKLHDVTVETRRTVAQCRVMPVPPEEFGISRYARVIKDTEYCFHDVFKPQSKLIADGFDEEQIKTLPTYVLAHTIEEIARDTVNESTLRQGSDMLNDASRLIRVTEHYVRMDYEGDGEARLYRVTTGGEEGEVLRRDGKSDIVEEDMIPFAAMTPVIVTHRFFGRSIADLILDIQRIKTALLRGMLDNLYLHNNPRVEVSEAHASETTLDDLLVSRPGGIVRTKQPGGLNWQEVPDITGSIYPALQYMDATREWRTGVSRQGQGVDPNALQNQVATIANQMLNATQAKIKLIARIFAETGIRDLFSLIHATIRKHGRQPDQVKLKTNWVTVDPRDWRGREDMTITVGLGTGSKAEQLTHLNLIISAQSQAVMAGLPIVSATNLYNSAKELTKLAGYKNPDQFFMAPGQPPDPNNPANAPLQKPPDPKQAQAQQQAQLQQEKMQGEAQREQLRLQTDLTLDQARLQIDVKKMEIEAQMKAREHETELAHAQQTHAMDMAQRQQQHEQQMTIAAHKAAQPKASTEVKPQQIADVVGPLLKHLNDTHAANMQTIAQALAAHSAPKRIKGPSGKVYQIENVQ